MIIDVMKLKIAMARALGVDVLDLIAKDEK